MQLFPQGTVFGTPSQFETEMAQRVDNPNNPSAFALMLSARARRDHAGRAAQDQNAQLNAMSWAAQQRSAQQEDAKTVLSLVKQAGEPGADIALRGSPHLAPYLQGVDLSQAGAFARRAAEAKIAQDVLGGAGKAYGEGVIPDVPGLAARTGVNMTLGAHPSVQAASVRGRTEKQASVQVPVFGRNVPPGAVTTIPYDPRTTNPADIIAQQNLGLNVGPPRVRQPTPGATPATPAQPAGNLPAASASVAPQVGAEVQTVQAPNLARAYARLPFDAQRDAMDLALARRATQPIVVMRGGVPHVMGASGKEYPLQVQ